VIVQAGASEAGRQLAAETAEVVFASNASIEEARAFYADVKARVTAAGRSADHFKILPGALVVVGHTREDAQEKRALLDSLVHPDSGVPNLSIRLGIDATGFELDAPLPEIPQSNQSQSGRDSLVALARRENLTVRQLAQLVGGFGGLQLVGTASDIADTMQSWLETGAADGFNIMFHTVPASLDDFVELVIPELQRRGIFRREYTGTTLREHLGLPRPANRFLPPPT
jgi:alkanesulfonate monooxygenase SsuD/methylene tetrahydromethanopterin reductase-like flavin-dependent oxidoreductase (luciferase family)